MSQVIRMGVKDASGIPMITAAALFVVLMFQVHPVDAGERSVAGTAGKPFRRIRVVLPSKAGSEMRKIAAETPHPRATDARSRGIRCPISISRLMVTCLSSPMSVHLPWLTVRRYDI